MAGNNNAGGINDNDINQKSPSGKSDSPLTDTPYEHWQYSENVDWDIQGGYSGRGGIRLIGGNKRGSYICYTINTPQKWKYLKFSGRIRTKGVIKGENPWNTARLLLYFRDAQNKAHWGPPHSLCSLVGDNNWKKYSRVFPVPEYAVTAHVLAQNAGKGGTVWVDDLSVVGADKKNNLFWINALAGLLWISVLIILIYVTRIWKLTYNWAVLGLIGLIILGVIIPQPFINTMVEKSKEVMITGFNSENSDHDSIVKERTLNHKNKNHDILSMIDESVSSYKHVGHISLFTLVCFFLNLSYNRKDISPPKSRNQEILPSLNNERKKPTETVSIVSIGLGLALFAGATEVLQFLTATRTPSIFDWLFDLAGIMVGFIFYIVFRLAGSKFSGSPLNRQES